MIPERGPQTVFKQFFSCAINVLQYIVESMTCNLSSAIRVGRSMYCNRRVSKPPWVPFSGRRRVTEPLEFLCPAIGV